MGEGDDGKMYNVQGDSEIMKTICSTARVYYWISYRQGRV